MPVVDERERRLAENEVFFRELNERIGESARRWDGDGDEHVYEFMCECPDRGCGEQIFLTVREYEALRQHPARFAVSPGHETPEIADEVDAIRDAVIAEKREEAARHVAKLDTRRGESRRP